MSRVRRYLAHFRGSGRILALAAVLLGVSGTLPGVAVLALQRAFDALVDGSDARPWLAALGLAATLQSVSMVGRAVLTRRLAADLVHRLRMQVHRRFHDAHAELAPVGSRLAALSVEADELQYGVSALVTALRNPIAVVVLGMTAIGLAPALAARTLLVVPVLAVLTALGGRLVRATTRRWAASQRALQAELQDQQAGLRTTLDLGAVELQMARAHVLSEAEARDRALRDWVRALPPAAVQLAVALALVGLLAWGVSAVRGGALTAGQLVAFTAAVALLQRPLTGLTEVWTLLQRSFAALERIEAVLATPAAARPTGDAFVLRNVRVDGRLGPIGLVLRPGEKVALVGESGSGKSTLLAVLAGLVEGEGDLRIGRALLLRQNPWVFDRSVRENLRLGDPGASDDVLRDALVSVGLDVALDRGLGEDMGERGERFSGGERQRLCLARALLSDPPVLLLDEATSEIDPVSSDRIARQLADRPGTVVFASHDPTFARHADRVLLLSGGRIVADGPHARLLETHAAYRAHWSGLGAVA
ncbi:MAG: ABC transporter ATP-binding protein [Myxococcota bacterium]